MFDAVDIVVADLVKDNSIGCSRSCVDRNDLRRTLCVSGLICDGCNNGMITIAQGDDLLQVDPPVLIGRISICLYIVGNTVDGNTDNAVARLIVK